MIPAPLRVAAALLFTVACALLPDGQWWFYALAAALLAATALAAGVHWAAWLKRLILVEPLAAGIALMALFLPDGEVRFASLLARSTLCLGAMTLLVATTPFPAILDALRRFRVPSLLATVLALTHRYLFLLRDELQRMARARRSRGRGPDGVRQWPHIAGMAGMLFIRATERAERVAGAMAARGWKP
jgi:cobalt/nickel transport system permease protein